MAGYKALYRKWRPSVFSDVIGQEHITDVLRSEVTAKTVSHAYLFCGSRGTGKTTCAKILAKAVSCDAPIDGDPCGVCPSCLAAESSLDIYEIDAASYNGVDNIRELRDTVAYPPSELKRRVYIIDEVHMLSTGAFNALLKTLEEPPEHVLFILATTELQKIPATILSRCKRFDFHRITAEKIAARLRIISDSESIPITDRALLLIARLAAGAMRDALSMLELFCMSDHEVDIDEASERLGVVGRTTVFALTEAIATKNTSRALGIIAEAYDNSKDLGVLCSELSDTLRDILIVKYAREPARLLDATDADIETLKKFSSELDDEKILYLSRLCEEIQAKLSRAVFSRRTILEIGMIRMCEEKLQTNETALLARIATLEDKVARLAVGLPAEPTIPTAKKKRPITDAEVQAPAPVTNADHSYMPTESSEFPPPPSDSDVPPESGDFDANVAHTPTPHREVKESASTSNSPSPASQASAPSGKMLDCYGEFVEDTRAQDKMAASMLEGGTVYLDDNQNAEIRTSNPVAPMILASEDMQQVLREALAKNIGYIPVQIKITFEKSDKTPERADLSSLL